jgi:hypothetical protein
MTDVPPIPPVPPPSKEWQAEEPWDSDPLASFEQDKVPLDAQLLEQDKKNRLAFRRHFGFISIISMYLIWTVIVVGAISWLWNYLTPWKFLTDAQLDKVQSIVFSGMMGAFASAWARRHIERD